MKQKTFNVFIFLAVFSLWIFQFIDYTQEDENTSEEVVVKLEMPLFLLSDRPEIHLKDALDYYGVKHSNIVMAQAILETGHFRSKVCKDYNNLFGLYNSKKGEYFKFNHWSESVVAYIDYIQRKYKPPGDYYKFLERIGYAEDPEYTSKVKSIVKKIENDKRRDSIEGSSAYS